MTLTTEDLTAIGNLIDSKLDAKLEPVKRQIQSMYNSIETINLRLNGFDSRFDNIEHRLSTIDQRLSKIDGRLGNIEKWIPTENSNLIH